MVGEESGDRVVVVVEEERDGEAGEIGVGEDAIVLRGRYVGVVILVFLFVFKFIGLMVR